MKKEELNVLLFQIIDSKVWQFSSGGGGGSILAFEFGEEVNLKQDFDELTSKKEGEGSFMIYSSWRIMKDNRIITSWKEECSPNGLLVIGLSILENQVIKNILLTNELDLYLFFENGLKLQIFCDEGINSDFDCNWFFRTKDRYLSINNQGEIEEDYY